MTNALHLAYEQRGVVPAPLEIIAAYQAWIPTIKNDFGAVVKRSCAYQDGRELPLEPASLSDLMHAQARAACITVQPRPDSSERFILSATLRHGSDYHLGILMSGETDEARPSLLNGEAPLRGALSVQLTGPHLTPQKLAMFSRLLKGLDAPPARIAQAIKRPFEKLCR